MLRGRKYGLEFAQQTLVPNSVKGLCLIQNTREQHCRYLRKEAIALATPSIVGGGMMRAKTKLLFPGRIFKS